MEDKVRLADFEAQLKTHDSELVAAQTRVAELEGVSAGAQVAAEFLRLKLRRQQLILRHQRLIWARRLLSQAWPALRAS